MIASLEAKRPMPVSPDASRPASGAYDNHAPLLQQPQVLLRGRVVEHVGIHGRGGHHGRGSSKHSAGEGVVGHTVGQLRQHVCSGGRNEHRVGGFRQGDMLNREVGRGVKPVGEHRLVGDAAEGQRGNEMLRGGRHYNAHLRA